MALDDALARLEAIEEGKYHVPDALTRRIVADQTGNPDCHARSVLPNARVTTIG